ncbi:MAG: DUF3307 domain-containing protein [Bacillota bacterium]
MTFMLSSTLAHLVADFILQSDRLVQEKDLLYVKAHIHHELTVLVCSTIALHFYGTLGLGLALLLTVTHAAIDYLKSRGRSDLPRRQLALFVLDQALHLVAITAVWDIFQPDLSEKVIGFYSANLMPRARALLGTVSGVAINDLLAIAVAYVSAVFAGASLVRYMLDTFVLPDNLRVDTGAGRYIGMLERALMLTLVLADALPSIAFVIAAKALARFKQLERAEFAEYYLLGTLSSTLIAITIGALLRRFIL